MSLVWEREDDRGWTRLNREQSDYISGIPHREIWPWLWTPRNGQEYTIRRSGDYSATQQNSRTGKQRQLRAYEREDDDAVEHQEQRASRNSYRSQRERKQYSSRDERYYSSETRRSPSPRRQSRSPLGRRQEDDRSFRRPRETRRYRRLDSPRARPRDPTNRSSDDRRYDDEYRFDERIERKEPSHERVSQSPKRTHSPSNRSQSRSQRTSSPHRATRSDERRSGDMERRSTRDDRSRGGRSASVDEAPSIHSEEEVVYVWRQFDLGRGEWDDCSSHVNAILKEMQPGTEKIVRYSGEEFVVQVDESGKDGRMENRHTSDGYSLRKTKLRECPNCSHANDIRNTECEQCFACLVEQEKHPDYRTMMGDGDSSDDDDDTPCHQTPMKTRDDRLDEASPFADGGGAEDTPPPSPHRSYSRMDDDLKSHEEDEYEDRQRNRDRYSDRDDQRSRRRSPRSDSGSRRSSRRPATRIWQFEDERGRWHDCDPSWIRELNGLRIGDETQVDLGRHTYTLERVSRNRGQQTNVASDRERRLRASLRCPSCQGLSHPSDKYCSRCEKPLETSSSRRKPRGTSDWDSQRDWDGPKRRKCPVHGNTIKTLYHCTSKESIDAILKSGKKMLRGQTGMLGGGIYFAERPGDACHKAFNRGYMIKAKVLVGRYHLIQGVPNEKWSFGKLYRAGYDSVYAKDGAGQGTPEWVVYNTDQVKIMKISPFNKRGKRWDRSKGGGQVSNGF